MDGAQDYHTTDLKSITETLVWLRLGNKSTFAKVCFVSQWNSMDQRRVNQAVNIQTTVNVS